MFNKDNKTYNQRNLNTRGVFKWILAVCGWLFWVAILGLVIVCAYGGIINPEKAVLPAILAMCFPEVLLVTVVLTIIAFFARRKAAAWLGVAAILICLPSFLTFCPVNLKHRPESTAKDEFTVMTWNIIWWYDYKKPSTSPTPNPDMQAVLEINPDILILQEADSVRADTLGITQEQYKLFRQRYKYHYANGLDMLSFYSRYPIIGQPEYNKIGGSGVYVKYQLEFQGHTLTIFNVHLQTLGFHAQDYELYRDLLHGIPIRSEVREAKDVLLHKLETAYKERALQAERLQRLIKDTPGNVLVCGDFNDIPGSYSVRTVKGAGMKDAYADAAFGPGLSFHRNKMYFRIDHILYRGDLRPLKTERLKVGQSDHYPLLSTFKWENEGNSSKKL